MKKITTLVVSCSMLLLSACDNNKSKDANEPSAKEATASNEDKDLTGTFTVNEKKYTGKVKASLYEQTGQYEVICDDKTDANGFAYIRILFKDEVSARAGGNFITEYDQQKKQAANGISMSFEVKYRTEEDSKGTVAVNKNGSNNELVFDNVSLRSGSTDTVIVSGKIPF
jgi:PBP1b-binding outer membrane lipoprotein LpoB